MICERRVQLTAAADRFALMAFVGPPGSRVIYTAAAGGDLEALDQPAVGIGWQLLPGGRLVSVHWQSGMVRAYDLRRKRPALTSLPPEEAIAAAAEDMKGEDSLCDRWRLIPNADAHWAAVAARYPDPHWSCAMSLIEPGDRKRGALLRKLLDTVKKPEDRQTLLGRLRLDRDPATSAFMATLARDPESPGRRSGPSTDLEIAYDHLWRTGRASSTRVCPSDRPRPDAGLRPGGAQAGIGTAHPLFFQAVSSTGSWTYVCQARKDSDRDGKVALTYRRGMHGSSWQGDDLEPYLVVGGGPGRELDQLLASDPTGRYLAVREGACLTLLDTGAATTTTLAGADLRGDLAEPPSRIAFDPTGRLLAYVRGGDAPRLVVRELQTGRERELDPGPGGLEAASFTADGRWVALTVGQPWPEDSYPVGVYSRCRTWTAGGFIEDEPAPRPTVRRWIPVAGGPPVERTDVITPFGDGLLVRVDDALVVEDRGGKRTVLAPADCKGTLVHADSGTAERDRRCARRWLRIPTS